MENQKMAEKTMEQAETVKNEDVPNKEKPVKPVTVRLEDFKSNLNQVVAESQLPPFLTVTALREMLLGIGNVAQMEYEQDLGAWEKECREYEEWLKTQEKGHKEGEKNG